MITIEAPSHLEDVAPNKAALARFLNRARTAVGLPGAIHVLLTDDRTLRRLNRTFRRKDRPTDILSFPAPPLAAPAQVNSHPAIAGDLAISLETAARQAARLGHSLRDEVRILLLHGVLHLAGFDHDADSGEMAAREAGLRHQLRLPQTLIARAAKSRTPRQKATPRSAPRPKQARP